MAIEEFIRTFVDLRCDVGCVARALCDTRNMGKLSKDQFALALYLIQQKLKGIDPPARLPPEMIPPTTRRSSLVVSNLLSFVFLPVFVAVLCEAVCCIE